MFPEEICQVYIKRQPNRLCIWLPTHFGKHTVTAGDNSFVEGEKTSSLTTNALCKRQFLILTEAFLIHISIPLNTQTHTEWIDLITLILPSNKFICHLVRHGPLRNWKRQLQTNYPTDLLSRLGLIYVSSETHYGLISQICYLAGLPISL